MFKSSSKIFMSLFATSSLLVLPTLAQATGGNTSLTNSQQQPTVNFYTKSHYDSNDFLLNSNDSELHETDPEVTQVVKAFDLYLQSQRDKGAYVPGMVVYGSVTTNEGRMFDLRSVVPYETSPTKREREMENSDIFSTKTNTSLTREEWRKRSNISQAQMQEFRRNADNNTKLPQEVNPLEKPTLTTKNQKVQSDLGPQHPSVNNINEGSRRPSTRPVPTKVESPNSTFSTDQAQAPLSRPTLNSSQIQLPTGVKDTNAKKIKDSIPAPIQQTPTQNEQQTGKLVLATENGPTSTNNELLLVSNNPIRASSTLPQNNLTNKFFTGTQAAILPTSFTPINLDNEEETVLNVPEPYREFTITEGKISKRNLSYLTSSPYFSLFYNPDGTFTYEPSDKTLRGKETNGKVKIQIPPYGKSTGYVVTNDKKNHEIYINLHRNSNGGMNVHVYVQDKNGNKKYNHIKGSILSGHRAKFYVTNPLEHDMVIHSTVYQNHHPK